jgi:CoA:oxalate CoA-transferase
MPAAGPLSGILVVDLTRVLAGPFCTLLLADLGARVIKVEAPGAGDDARRIGHFVGGVSAYFLSLNRGKESLALDLKRAEDRRLFEKLLARADVLAENFRPGVMQRLGYGWDTLEARFPRLVMASISGFGQTGPYAQRPAYDVIAQAMGGVMSMTGHPGGGPTRVGTSTGDITAGLFAAVGILAALNARQRSGRGSRVDVSMLDAQVATLENAIVRYLASGEVPGPLGTRHPSIAPFQALATADGFIVVAAGNDALFARLCRAVGRPELAQAPEFASNELRTQAADALAERLEQALAAHGSAHWLETLAAAGIPCGPVNDVAQVVADPQVAARNMLVSVAGSALRVAGNPVKLSGFPDPGDRAAPPALDEGRARILAELGEEGRLESRPTRSEP